jgi:hypothetical protein
MGAWVALGFFATVVLVLAVRSTDWFGALTLAPSAPAVVEGGATSAATPVKSAETEPVQARPEVEAPADAAPAATTTPAEEAGAPVPKPAPVTRAVLPAIPPVPVGVPMVRAKPKPKPAPTIDDGF